MKGQNLIIVITTSFYYGWIWRRFTHSCVMMLYPFMCDDALPIHVWWCFIHSCVMMLIHSCVMMLYPFMCDDALPNHLSSWTIHGYTHHRRYWHTDVRFLAYVLLRVWHGLTKNIVYVQITSIVHVFIVPMCSYVYKNNQMFPWNLKLCFYETIKKIHSCCTNYLSSHRYDHKGTNWIDISKLQLLQWLTPKCLLPWWISQWSTVHLLVWFSRNLQLSIESYRDC